RGGSHADVRHHGELVAVAQLAAQLEEVQAVAAVHVRADVDLYPQDDVAIFRRRLARGADLPAHVAQHFDIRVAQVRVLVDVAENARLLPLDDVTPEACGAVAAEAAGVHPGGYAGARRHGVRLDTQAGDGVTAV